jgi:hypothetical protein
MEGDGDDTREVIVEAKVPPRTVRLGQALSERHLPKEILTEGEGDRGAVLQELQADLNRLLGHSTNPLRAAGAIAVRANREQLLEITKHPLVRAVRPNRRLKPGSLV